MAVSRPFVLALLGAVLAVATFASMRSAGDRAQAERSAAAPTLTPKPGRSSVTDAPALRKAPPGERSAVEGSALEARAAEGGA